VDAGGYGTVFKVTRVGKEKVLYAFNDGGGAVGYGTVFKVTTAGTEKVVYPFKGGSDGRAPAARMIYLNRSFYGTIQLGGAAVAPTTLDAEQCSR